MLHPKPTATVLHYIFFLSVIGYEMLKIVDKFYFMFVVVCVVTVEQVSHYLMYYAQNECSFTIMMLYSAFSTRLFSVLRFESVIHEFDPYFNYRTTRYLSEEGFYSFHNWFDDRAWYPLGRIIGGTIYPGTPM